MATSTILHSVPGTGGPADPGRSSASVGHHVGHARCLGQAIALFHAATEALPAGAGHRLAQRRRAPEDESEPREVVLGHDRVPAEFEDDRRRERRRALPGSPEGGAGRFARSKRGMRTSVAPAWSDAFSMADAGDVEEGEDDDDRVVFRRRDHRPARSARRDQVAVGQHHPFRAAGRAAGVGEERRRPRRGSMATGGSGSSCWRSVGERRRAVGLAEDEDLLDPRPGRRPPAPWRAAPAR